MNNTTINKKMTVEEIANFNAEQLEKAINSVMTEKGINWDTVAQGVKYIQFDDNDSDIKKEYILKVTDLVIAHPNKKSTKKVLSKELVHLLTAFGANLTNNKALHLETSCTLKLYTQFLSNSEEINKAFFGENPTSRTSLEKQYQIVVDSFGIKETIKKSNNVVEHLVDRYVKVNKDGWKSGKELNLLQCIINDAPQIKANHKFVVISKNASFTAPKDNKK